MSHLSATNAATRIRPARPADAAVLTRLALSSKAAWGYDAGFIAACRAELTITPQSILRQPTHVLERQGETLGFYQLRLDGAAAEVAHLFIAPAMLRRGLGRRLFAHLEALASAARARRLAVDSDPHAEAFYLAMGMRRVGVGALGQHCAAHAAAPREGNRAAASRPDCERAITRSWVAARRRALPEGIWCPSRGHDDDECKVSPSCPLAFGGPAQPCLSPSRRWK